MKDKIVSGILNLKLKLCLGEYLKGVHYFRLLEYPVVYENLNLKTGFRVLDAGSNYINFFSLFLASERKFQVHAIDSQKITKNIRKHLDKTIVKLNLKDNIFIKSMDMRKLSYPNNYFDRVYSISSIEHIKGIGEDAKAIKELTRVLKKGGLLVITFPFSKDKHIELEKWGGEEYSQRHYSYETVIKRIIKPSGLKFVNAVHFGEKHPGFGRLWIRLPNFLKDTTGWILTLFSKKLWSIGSEYKSNFNPPVDSDGNFYYHYGVTCLVLQKA